MSYVPLDVLCRSLKLSPADTVLAYKQRQKLGRFAEKSDEESQRTEEDVNIQVGSRCQVESTEPGFHKRGTVRFVGRTKFSPGAWVGVEYDEPIGKNDGASVSRFLLISYRCTDRRPWAVFKGRDILNVDRDTAYSFDRLRLKPEISRWRKSTLMKRYNDWNQCGLYIIYPLESCVAYAAQGRSRSEYQQNPVCGQVFKVVSSESGWDRPSRRLRVTSMVTRCLQQYRGLISSGPTCMPCLVTPVCTAAWAPAGHLAFPCLLPYSLKISPPNRSSVDTCPTPTVLPIVTIRRTHSTTCSNSWMALKRTKRTKMSLRYCGSIHSGTPDTLCRSHR